MSRQEMLRRIATRLERLDILTLEGLLIFLEGQAPLADDTGSSLADKSRNASRETGSSLSAAGIPYTGDPETDRVLDDHPDILERLRRLEAGEEKLIPWEQVKGEMGL